MTGMTLKEWLKTNNISLQECADRLGRDHSVIVRYCKRQVNPSPETMARILEWTNGAIAPADLLALPRQDAAE